MSKNSNIENDDSFEDELISEFGDKDEEESLSEIESKLRPKEERLGMQAPEDIYIYDNDYIAELGKKDNNSKIIKKEERNTRLIIKVGFIIIFICVILDAIMIGYRLLYKDKIDILPVLLYTEKPVVFDNATINKKQNDHVPFININNSSLNDINNEINRIYNNYNNNNPDYFRYDYAVNDNMLSVVLIYRNKNESETNYSYKFKTYNISLKTLYRVEEDYILGIYKLKKSEVHKKMKEDFYKHYEELIKKNYINDKYSFGSVIDDLELSNFVSETNYYIEDNNLYVYRSYNIYNNEKLSTYFDESCYKFFIKKGGI